MTAASLMAAAVIVLTPGLAAADPSPGASAPAVIAPSAGASAPGTAAPKPAPSTGVPAPKPGTITWAVQPSSAQGPDGRAAFSYNNLKAGTIAHDYVGVTNFSGTPVTFDLYPTDAFNNDTGALDLLPAADKPKDVGSWISINKTSVTLQPGERVNEPFTLTIPASAAPGDHTGGIIASVSVDAKNDKGEVVKVDRRLAAPLYLRVAGDLMPALAIESVSSAYHGSANPFRGGGVDVTYTVHNTGNVRLDLSQDVSAKGLFGFSVASLTLKPLKDLLPGATYHATVHLTNVFPLGPMSVHISGKPTQPAGIPAAAINPQAVSFDASMWATPWLLILILVLIVGVLVGLWWLLRWRRGRRGAMVAEAAARARRETVEQLRKKAIAAKAKVDAGTKGSG
jgi:hypothetical protein